MPDTMNLAIPPSRINQHRQLPAFVPTPSIGGAFSCLPRAAGAATPLTRHTILLSFESTTASKDQQGNAMTRKPCDSGAELQAPSDRAREVGRRIVRRGGPVQLAGAGA